MYPLPIVSLIIGLFLVSALALAGLIVRDNLAERRLKADKGEHDGSLQLSLDSLIQELTAYA